jgi:hypothetical protein
MRIKVPYPSLRTVQDLIKRYRLRHGPFERTGNEYIIYLYPDNKNTLFLLTLGGQELEVLDMGN